MRAHRFWINAAMLSMALLCGAETLGEYRIKLSRPEHRGDTYPISVTGEFKQSLTVEFPGQQPLKQEGGFAVQLEGTIKVAVVDDSGEASRLDCIVSKCLKDGQPLLEPGTVITAENKTGQTQFLANGNPVAANTAAALQLVLNAHQPGEPTGEAMFETDKPQPIGGQWPINHDAAARGFTKSGLPVNKNDVTGTTKLASIEKRAQGPALRIDASFHVNRLAGVMPDGTELQSGSIDGRYGGLFPVDSTKRPLDESESVDLHMVRKVQGRNNQVGTATMDVHRQLKVSYGPAAQ